MDDRRFRCPCSVLVVGPSQSGKTTFTHRLLEQAPRAFNKQFRKIVYCYGEWQPSFDTIQRQLGVEFHHGLPENVTDLFGPHDTPGLLVMDDLMDQMERVVRVFTQESHHHDITTVFLTQNLFPPNKHARTISLNTHYIVLFKNPRDCLGVQMLAQQAFPGRVPYVMDSFKQATEAPHGYLLLDFHPSTPDTCRLRSHILPNDFPMYVYVPQL